MAASMAGYTWPRPLDELHRAVFVAGLDYLAVVERHAVFHRDHRLILYGQPL